MRGALNPNWNGGQEKRRLDRVEYKNWRRAVFERDKFTCQHCFQIGGRLNAHHIKSWTKYPELRFVLENGETLCVKCHHKHHSTIKKAA
jgi:5-methylcytosine-specific restriction endonuclease McrA